MEANDELIKNRFEQSLKENFKFSNESVEILNKMIEDGQISVPAMQRKFGLGYSTAAKIFDNVILCYAPLLNKNVEAAIESKIFNEREILFITRSEFYELQSIGLLFDVCRKTKNEFELEILNTEKFKELCKIVLCLDFKNDFRKRYLFSWIV